MIVVHALAFIVVVLVCAALVQSIFRRSPTIGIFVASGLVLRTIAGVVLFWISARHLPVLQDLQIGGGFWVMAVDGRAYYDLAWNAASGIATISPASASRFYTQLLAVSLWIFGRSPLTSLLVNVAAYVVSCTVVTSMWPPLPSRTGQRTRLAAIVALTLSPSLLLAGTQPLKDQVFALFVIVALASIKRGLTAIATPGPESAFSGVVAIVTASPAVYAIAGIRVYYAMFIVLATPLVMAALVVRLPIRRWPLHLLITLLATMVLWESAVTGAGRYYATPYRRFVMTVLHVAPGEAGSDQTELSLGGAREGFIAAGGDTNIVRRHVTGTPTLAERLEDEVLGMSALLVPITLLRMFSIVAFAGGRGLLAIADIDTLFLDVTAGVQLWLVFRHWRSGRRDVPFLLLSCGLAATVLLLMAYVVTNYGTMFRLRLMFAIPVWLSGAAAPIRPRQLLSESSAFRASDGTHNITQV